MKELCIDVRMAMSSGIGTYIRNLIRGLKEGPFRLRLIVDRKTLEKCPFLTNFDLILVKASVYSIEEQIKLPFIIPSCDLFWSPHYNIPLMPIRAKKRMVTIHDVYHLAYGHTLSIHKKMYAQALISQAVKRSDLVITISQFSRSELVRYVNVDPGRINVILLGVDRTHFYPREDIPLVTQKLAAGVRESALKSTTAGFETASVLIQYEGGFDRRFQDTLTQPSGQFLNHERYVTEVLKKYHLPDKYLLFVGNLAPHKNIQGLLKALRYLQDKTWKLVLVGAKTNTTVSLENNQHQVLVLGSVADQDLPCIYQGAQMTVHPSFYEGFGLTPLEAMSCGCPVVVSKTASLPEVCGDCAVYIDPHCPKSIAWGIEEMALLRDSLKMKGLERSQSFTWKKCVEKHIEMMEKLVGSS